jgi:scyllo-inositol 2-dehydrogenase (NADP+)
MYKVGILGMGKMAGFHAEWIAENEGLELTAICEKREDRIDEIKKQYGVPVFTDADEFFAKGDIDVAIITATNELHEKFSIKALEAGKHVVVEKPMSTDYEGAKRMIETAEKTGRLLTVHQSSRWDRDFLLVREIKQSGLIGDFLVVKSNANFCDEFWPSWGIDGMADPWRIKSEHFGGILLDWGVHLIDQILILMEGNPLDVYGFLQSGVWTKEVDDHFFASFRFPGDVLCQLEASNNDRIPLPRWHIIGTKGSLEVKGKPEPFWDETEMIYIDENGKKERRNITFYDVCESGSEGGFYRELVSFLDGKHKGFVSMYEAAEVINVIDAVRESHAEGVIVKL